MLGCWKEGGVGLQIDKNVIHIYMYAVIVVSLESEFKMELSYSL